MSNFEFSRKYAEVKVPKRSGFDKSFKNLLTTKVGTITPILCDEVIPNTKVYLKTAINACLPPLASETFMNCNLKVEAFFVPMRQLYGGFESWLTGESVPSTGNPNGSFVQVGMPTLKIDTSSVSSAVIGSGTLVDYLGYKLTSTDVQAIGSTPAYFNLMPLVCYHWIYDNWYRNSVVQRPIFTKPISNSNPSYIASIPFTRVSTSNTPSFTLLNQFPDGVYLGQLRQRNFDIDYFTSATPNAQLGNPQSVTMNITIPSSGSSTSTSFSIPALRAANSLQQFAERQNLAGFRLVDYVKSNYGANLSDGMAQRPLFLGQQVISVYTKGVNQTAALGTTVSNNPFDNVGAQYGKAVIVGSGNLIDNFTANEPGYIFVNATLVPKVTYSTGILRQNMHYTSNSSQVDMANPLLQNTGNQPIYQGELNATKALSNPTDVFGYTDRYAEYMTREDELHGLVRDGESLQAFALQRTFAGNVTQGNNFLQIPTNYMDQVTATTADISSYGCWMDCYFDYKVSMPLAEYSIPSLQDPAYEHGKEVTVKRGGTSVY